MKRKTILLITGGICLLSATASLQAAPKPAKSCDINKARPANRFGSYLLPKPEVEAQPQSSEGQELLLVPDDAISAPERTKKPRKRKQSSIQPQYESC
jgi:hypothetical protein